MPGGYSSINQSINQEIIHVHYLFSAQLSETSHLESDHCLSRKACLNSAISTLTCEGIFRRLGRELQTQAHLRVAR